MRKVATNLKILYFYKFLSEFYLIGPILIPYYKLHGLNATQVFSIQATYAAVVLLLEIPSGYLADVIGRKKTLLLGACGLPLGLAVYGLTDRFWTFILAESLLAIGASMRSGCDSAMIYDTLLQLREEAAYKKFEGRTQFFTRIGSSIASVTGGLAAMLSLHIPFYINFAASLFMLPLAMALVEPERSKPKGANPLRAILNVCVFCFSHPRLRRLMLLAAVIMSTGITGIWAYFLYYESISIRIGLFGILFAVSQLSSALGSQVSHRLSALLGPKKALLLPLSIGCGFIVLGAIPSWLCVPVVFLNLFMWGYAFPLLLEQMNLLITSDIRATALSVASMSGSLAFAILAPLFGRLVDAYSLGTAFIVLGLFSLAASAWLLFSHLGRFKPDGEQREPREPQRL